MEKQKDSNGLYYLDGYPLTKYTKIKNCYIAEEYSCNDLGVTSISKKEALDICSPISLVSVKYDSFKQITYYEFQFYNKHNKKSDTILFDGSEIGKEVMIEALKKKGVSIVNSSSFNKFINIMIRSNEKVVDYNEQEENPTNFLKSQVGANSYGWVYTENGYDFSRFITKKEIIYKNPDIDGPLYEKKGTLEEQLRTMDDIRNDFKNPDIFEAALTFSYTGVILPMCGIDNPVFLLTGPSGVGKQICSDEAVGQLGKPHTTGRGLQRASGDSEASRNSYRSKFGVHTIWVDEVQDLINKNLKKNITPSETIKQEAYEITVGTNGSRSTDKGKIRDDINISHCPVVFCCEGNQFADLNDGGSSRILIIDSGLADGELYLKSGDTEQYRQRIYKNYGHTYMIFVEYIKGMMEKDENTIGDMFKDYKKIALKYTTQSKIANNTALEILTHNLMIESGCVPSTWKKWDVDAYSRWIISMNEFKSSTKLVMDSWLDGVLSNGCIPFYETSKRWSQNVYDDLSRNSNTRIRGKKEIIDNKLYVYIPEKELIKQLEYEAKIQGITGFCFDKDRLFAAGYLMKSGDKSHPYRFKMQNICGEFNAALHTPKENVMKVCLELEADETENYKEKQEEAKKQSEEFEEKMKNWMNLSQVEKEALLGPKPKY